MGFRDNKQINNKITVQKCILVIILFAAVIFSSVFFSRYISDRMFDDRASRLTKLSGQAADLFDSEISAVRENLSLAEYRLSREKIGSAEELFFVLGELDKTHLFGTGFFFALDDSGNYYSSDMNTGIWQTMDMLIVNAPEEYSEITTFPFGSGSEYMVIYKKTENDISPDSVGPRVMYLASAIPAEELLGKTDGDSCITYISDRRGNRLCISANENDHSAGDNIAFTSGETGYFEFISADGQKWSASAAVTDFGEFELMLVVPSSEFSAETKKMMMTAAISFAVIAAGVSVIIVLLSLSSIKTAFEKRLRKHREENDVLLDKALREAEKANREKSEFLSRMSHDIRTPLNSIMGMTSIAMKNTGDENKIRDCLKKIDSSSQHLFTLINDVLDMSRIESGRMQKKEEPFDIRIMLDACRSIILGKIGSRRVELICEYGEFVHTRLIGDEYHLRQIIVSILGNSVKFTEDGGRIYIRASELPSEDGKARFRFELEDTGIGMKTEFLPKLFDEFSRENDISGTDNYGSGLGLCVTKKLVEMLGGTVGVESTTGIGTKFTLEFDMDINTEPEPVIHASGASDCIKGMKILLTEDNELNAEIAKEILEDSGAVITLARNGREAVYLFSKSEPYAFDAVLMDIMMPEMDGIQATRAIRSMEREDSGRIPIIAMTANAYDEDIRKTKEAGMNAHLSKPLDISRMIGTLTRIFSSSSKRNAENLSAQQ